MSDDSTPRWRCPNCAVLTFTDQIAMLEHAIECDGSGTQVCPELIDGSMGAT